MKLFKNFLCLTFLLLVAITACKKINIDAEVTNIDTDIYSTPIKIRFIDIDTNSKKFIDSFQVSIVGPDSNFIRASDGGTYFWANHNILNLSVSKTGTPSLIKPVVFTIIAQPKGYDKIIHSFTVTDTVPILFTVNVKSKSNNNIDGITKDTSKYTLDVDLSTGCVRTPIIFQGQQSSNQPYTITIPPNTIFYDGNGNPILPTDGSSKEHLDMSVTEYGCGKPQAQAVFPGGLNPATVVGPDGPIQGGVQFITAGMLDLSLSIMPTLNPVANVTIPKTVKRFSNPVTVTMQMDPNIINPQTSNQLQPGDSLPIWSLDDATGVWTFESMSWISNSNGKLFANFIVTHLSAWNLDWGWKWGTINKSLKVNLLTPNQPNFTGYPYEITLVDQNYNYLAGDHYQYVFNNYTSTMPIVPTISQARFVLTKSGYWNFRVDKLAETNLFNPSSQGNIDLIYNNAPAPPDYVNMKFNITGRCSNKNIVINVGTWVDIWTDDWSEYYNRYVSNGGYSNYNTPIKLTTGKKYNIGIYYGGSWNQSYFTAAKSGFVLPSVPYGGGLISGAAVYDNANNQLNFTTSFSVYCK